VIPILFVSFFVIFYWGKSNVEQFDPDLNNSSIMNTITDKIEDTMADVRVAAQGSPVADMVISDAMIERFKVRERLKLNRYELGDGGWTIGYGHFTKYDQPAPPLAISEYQADLWFREDLEERCQKWVRKYVTIPLTQNQYDALCSLSFNLSPKALKRICDEVNAGRSPEPVMFQYVRQGTNLERGLRIRRTEEFAIFNGTLEA
jgi:lysozyme